MSGIAKKKNHGKIKENFSRQKERQTLPPEDGDHSRINWNGGKKIKKVISPAKGKK